MYFKIVNQFKSIFVSDTHLGSSYSKKEEFLNFLRCYDAENWFLVGDIIDKSAILRHGFKYWDQTDNTIIQKLLKKSRKGSNIYIFDSNHFVFPEVFLGESCGNIKILEEMIYDNGHYKVLINHGHKNDWSLKVCKGILPHLGSASYDMIIKIEKILSRIGKIFGRESEHKISGFFKKRIKFATGSFVSKLQEYSVEECKENNCDIIIQGHTHQALDKNIDGVSVMNCGAWVFDSVPTFIVENLNGEFELRYYGNKID